MKKKMMMMMDVKISAVVEDDHLGNDRRSAHELKLIRWNPERRSG
jgi:hypothetical protein